jgi:hypothetical protein
MPDMASPDRLIFVAGKVLEYSDPDQITICSSWWANKFFGAETDRERYLQKLCKPYLDSNNSLNFTEIFSEMDKIIKDLLTTPPQERFKRFQYRECLLSVPKTCQIFQSMKHMGTKVTPNNDFRNAEEIRTLLKAFDSRCAVSGLSGRDFMLSVDRKIDKTGRYSWTDVNPMLWSINSAKATFRFVFETDSDLDLWYAEHHGDYDDYVNQTLDACDEDRNDDEIGGAVEEIRQTWVVIIEMRRYFCDLLRYYHTRKNLSFM